MKITPASWFPSCTGRSSEAQEVYGHLAKPIPYLLDIPLLALWLKLPRLLLLYQVDPCGWGGDDGVRGGKPHKVGGLALDGWAVSLDVTWALVVKQFCRPSRQALRASPAGPMWSWFQGAFSHRVKCTWREVTCFLKGCGPQLFCLASKLWKTTGTWVGKICNWQIIFAFCCQNTNERSAQAPSSLLGTPVKVLPCLFQLSSCASLHTSPAHRRFWGCERKGQPLFQLPEHGHALWCPRGMHLGLQEQQQHWQGAALGLWASLVWHSLLGCKSQGWIPCG